MTLLHSALIAALLALASTTAHAEMKIGDVFKFTERTIGCAYRDRAEEVQAVRIAHGQRAAEDFVSKSKDDDISFYCRSFGQDRSTEHRVILIDNNWLCIRYAKELTVFGPPRRKPKDEREAVMLRDNCYWTYLQGTAP